MDPIDLLETASAALGFAIAIYGAVQGLRRADATGVLPAIVAGFCLLALSIASAFVQLKSAPGIAQQLAKTDGATGTRPIPPPPSPLRTAPVSKARPYVVRSFTLQSNHPLVPQHGGLGLILLKNTMIRSKVICHAFSGYIYLADLKNESITVIDDTIFGIRPLYWLIRQHIGHDLYKEGNRHDICDTLVSSYDLERAGNYLDRLGLHGEGPFLVVADYQTKLRNLGAWDLSRVPDDELGDSFDDFLHYYTHGDTWIPDRVKTANTRQMVKYTLLRWSPTIESIFNSESAKAAVETK